MMRWIWIATALVVSTSVYFTIRHGLRPKPIPVLNPTFFQQPQQIGAVIYKRLRQNIRSEKVFVVGLSSQFNFESSVWQGFFQEAQADRLNLLIFQQEDISAEAVLPPPLKAISFSSESMSSGRLLEEIKAQSARNQIVVVIARVEDSSHFFPDSLSQKLDRAWRHPVLSLSSLLFTINMELNPQMDECHLSDERPSPRMRLDCATYRVSKKFRKKKLDANQFWAVMERHGLKEYLLFVHAPTYPAN